MRIDKDEVILRLINVIRDYYDALVCDGFNPANHALFQGLVDSEGKQLDMHSYLEYIEESIESNILNSDDLLPTDENISTTPWEDMERKCIKIMGLSK